MDETRFYPGASLFFTTDSPLHTDAYRVVVQAVHPDRLELGLFLHHGYLLLLPTGTRLRWFSEAGIDLRLESCVLGRHLEQKSWSVTLPASAQNEAPATPAQIIAVASGKGGVGKTTLSINLGLAMVQNGQRVILLDADIGMADIEIVLGIQGSLNLSHVIRGECTLQETLVEGPGGLRVLPGTRGILSLTQLGALEFNRILSGFSALESMCDVLIIDTQPGLSDSIIRLVEAADEFLLLTNPEPHALVDGYSLAKAVCEKNPGLQPGIVVNRCESIKEAEDSFEALRRVMHKFLQVQPAWLGWLPQETLISRSIKDGHPLLLTHPRSAYSRKVFDLANKLTGTEAQAKKASGLKAFWQRFTGSAAY